MNEEGLRDWFGKSKSKDGKSGWVNVVTGGTCASDEPGEGTPKCVSSAKRASMSKAERLSAQRRKKKADPGQQQKSGAAKPTYVSTDSKKKMKTEETLHEDEYRRELARERRAERDAEKNYRSKGRKVPDKKKGPKLSTTKKSVSAGKDYADSQMSSIKLHDKLTKKNKNIVGLVTKEEVSEAKDKPGKGSGKKDACYHKVKSRYSVWPSAYASGALVKCRKKGAANWGNKSESYEFSNWRDDFKATEYEFIDLIKPEPIKGGQEQIDEGQKCWKGYEKKGTKKMFGKTYNNCVKKEEFEKEVPSGDIRKLTKKAVKRIDRDADGDVDGGDKGGGEYGEFVPSPDGRKKIVTKIKKEQFSDWRSEIDEGAAWTKKSGKSESGGLNEKGRKSYERENPGSDLKAPSKKVGNPRRKSFCARMKGMKNKLTSSKTANDPDSRINKSLRAWNC